MGVLQDILRTLSLPEFYFVPERDAGASYHVGSHGSIPGGNE